MSLSWSQRARNFKSPLHVVAAILLRSRENKAEKCRRTRRELNRLREKEARQQKGIDEQAQEINELRRKVRQLEAEKEANHQERQLPEDPPIGTHGYGPRMVSLSVNLARVIGLRSTTTVLAVVFQWLGVKTQVPHWTAIRTWMQRVGIAALEEPIEEADDWVWMADHSNQIGPEKALCVVAIRASKMPEAGSAICHEDIRLLTLEPATSWKREDMEQAYQRLAEKYKAPRGLIVDGATELREGAQCLQNQGTTVLGDFKHYAANAFKHIIGKSETFTDFTKRVGQTRAAIQQTELAHLTPPSLKTKSRFMNLKPLLDWAGMMLWLLENPSAEARKHITDARLEEKLGWLREFSDKIEVWRACQEVISTSLTFINAQGLHTGATKQLRQKLAVDFSDRTKREPRVLAGRLLRFIKHAEESLKAGERLPISTEILESSFSLYKQLERQHSKGGFTSLLAGFGAMLKPTTPESVQLALSRVSVKDTKAWVKKHLGDTLGSKRRKTYEEFKNASKRATKIPATT